jgi:type III secretion protein U
MSEKTEQATPKKREQARKEGQFARSRVLSGAAVVFGALLGATAAWPSVWAQLSGWTGQLWTAHDFDAKGALDHALLLLAWAVLPPLVGGWLGGALAATAFAGFRVDFGQIAFKPERISPGQGFRRLFSVQSWADAARAGLVAIVLAAVLWSGVRNAAYVLSTPRLESQSAFAVILQAFRSLAWRGALALLVLGAADYLYARWKHERDLRMTREEVKQEFKDAEGDPRHKAERKAKHRAIASGGPARGVQKASAVVVNPTHIAVALRYETSECEAPYLVAKGHDEDAQKLRSEAQALGIPVVRDVPLARSLVHYDVGEEIPEELYAAAAAVLKVALASRQAD